MGALAREVRAASLLAFMLALPIAFLALGFEYQGAHRIDHHLEEGDMDRSEQKGQAEEKGQ